MRFYSSHAILGLLKHGVIRIFKRFVNGFFLVKSRLYLNNELITLKIY